VLVLMLVLALALALALALVLVLVLPSKEETPCSRLDEVTPPSCAESC